MSDPLSTRSVNLGGSAPQAAPDEDTPLVRGTSSTKHEAAVLKLAGVATPRGAHVVHTTMKLDAKVMDALRAKSEEVNIPMRKLVEAAITYCYGGTGV